MIKFSVKKPMTILVSVILVLVLGVVSFMKLTPDLMPNIDMPYVMVMTAYPGATPEKVEDEVSKPLEQRLSTLENIKNIQSVSAANYSLILMEFSNEVNMDTVSVDILQNVNMISYSWDDTVGTPTILKMNPSMIPVSVAAVSSTGMDNDELSDFVSDTLMNRLEGIDGVAGIEASGLLESQINVCISQDKIDEINNRILASVNSELAAAQKKLLDGRNQLAKAQSELDKNKEKYEESKDDAVDRLSDAASKLDAAQAKASALATQISILEGTKQSLQAQLDSGLSDPETTAQIQNQLHNFNWFRSSSQGCLHVCHRRARQHGARSYAAAAHAVWRTYTSQRLRKAVGQTALFRGIIHTAAGFSIYGTDIDDHAAPVIAHMRKYRTSKQHWRAEIDLNAPVDDLQRLMHEVYPSCTAHARWEAPCE